MEQLGGGLLCGAGLLQLCLDAGGELLKGQARGRTNDGEVR
jgi:hypothetical protein